ncbi:tyrosine-type recombinase/integrase [Vibrio fluvialis]|nr:tyrosine-type recombinase/integrase [Vibrio fluvialis]
MSIFHKLFASRQHTYLIQRAGIYYFSIRHSGKLLRKSLFTDDIKTARTIVGRILAHRFDESSYSMLKSVVESEIRAYAYELGLGLRTQSNTCYTDMAVSKGQVIKSIAPATDLTFTAALSRWVEDKTSNLYQKSNGQRPLAKTVNEKIGYLRHIFPECWKNRTITSLNGADIDYALQLYSISPRKNVSPWCHMNPEEQIEAASSLTVPVEDRFRNSLHRVKTALNCFFEYYWRKNIIDSNPVKDVRFQTSKTYNPRGKLSPADIRKLCKRCFSTVDSPLSVAVLLQLFTGLRNKEIASLDASDVKRHKGIHYIHVRGSKTENAERYVPIHRDLIERGVLSRIGPNILQLSSQQMTYFFNKLLKRLNISNRDDSGNIITFYSLRHAFATALANAGSSDIHIEWLLGHAHTGTKSKYIGRDQSIVIPLEKTINKIKY